MTKEYVEQREGVYWVAGTRVTLDSEQAQANLPEIIDRLGPGEELIITRNNQVVARLVGQSRPVRKPRQPGSAKGKLIIYAEDNEHLGDFKEYKP